ncbi:MAG: lipoyl(octanoyl) transferase LipB [Candidatus Pseudobacter hemicellulosilyticus]|uniref:Octanoyltransferase n=1 Tax=Candidatus Pseudobacter hemicellulosilyticus TaxID=3121375 RepID=A0AAJ6BGE7_9BACT|nr:MAG: lipoyl(octanoyl) transferase LipB [Pseudobacter sp.]
MTSTTRQPVRFQDLGTRDYREIWDYQEQLLQANVDRKRAFNEAAPAATELLAGCGEVLTGCSAGALPVAEDLREGPVNRALLAPTEHHLLFVEHPLVYTLGKSGKMEHVLISPQEQAEKGIQFYHINRGGDITFHGPGQLVGYPVLDLEKFYTDIGRYLRNLEEVFILTMAEYGLKGERSAGETGVWLDTDDKAKARKICAMGIRCSRWVTMHGFAFNVNTDLSYFGYIIPCGIQDKQVTSLEKELGRKLDMEEVKEKVKRNFEKVFEAVLV